MSWASVVMLVASAGPTLWPVPLSSQIPIRPASVRGEGVNVVLVADVGDMGGVHADEFACEGEYSRVRLAEAQRVDPNEHRDALESARCELGLLVRNGGVREGAERDASSVESVETRGRIVMSAPASHECGLEAVIPRVVVIVTLERWAAVKGVEFVGAALALLAITDFAARVRPVVAAGVSTPDESEFVGRHGRFEVTLPHRRKRVAEGTARVDEGVVDVEEHGADLGHGRAQVTGRREVA